MINITEQVSDVVAKSDIQDGAVTVFNIGSTAGITTTEFEPGLANYDLKAAFETVCLVVLCGK